MAMATQTHVESLSIDKSVDLQILNYSGKEFRECQLSASGGQYDKLVVGAAMFRHIPNLTSSKMPCILLLKRAPLEPYFPNIFELPSGKVDSTDPTLKHALVREVKEETGLDITKISAQLSPMTYQTEKTIKSDAGVEVFVVKSAIQLNYVVSVSDGMVKLSVDEHSESRWATEEELDELDITDETRRIIREAFQWNNRQ
ncbi:Nudix hydrolase domain-containing protein [Trichoderma simmonsii]|uniref:Nudix hydrolase domain-containing protein n=1 Tax=Trichoderma simmonsii TaxID=1491479 RepID=A0A8G0L160_9HYPO|nr:Nudix hydrolase domain-containing protein [Trichoderma simmonsii]